MARPVSQQIHPARMAGPLILAVQVPPDQSGINFFHRPHPCILRIYRPSRTDSGKGNDCCHWCGSRYHAWWADGREQINRQGKLTENAPWGRVPIGSGTGLGHWPALRTTLEIQHILALPVAAGLCVSFNIYKTQATQCSARCECHQVGLGYVGQPGIPRE
jgi:hypothetical protein